MGKLKVRLSFKEFSLELEGTRDEIPQIGQNLGRQIAGLITSPAANVLPGGIPAVAVNDHVSGSPQPVKRTKPRKPSSKSDMAPPTWTYDGQAYGLPRQSWSSNDKAMWTLFVAEKTLGLKQMGAAHITKTFNEHYQAAKRINRGGVYNGLESLRAAEKSPVGKTDDGLFFLTEEGYKYAGKLIAQAEANA